MKKKNTEKSLASADTVVLVLKKLIINLNSEWQKNELQEQKQALNLKSTLFEINC